MIDIFKNNLKEFNINDTSNTIVCDANEIKNSDILNSLSPIQKNNIHLNVKIYCDKDIENFIYLEQDSNYKSINIILSSDFNLSKTACQKLTSLVNLNSVLKCNEDNKFKGCSFKNYYITTAIFSNEDTTTLLSDDVLSVLKNFSIKENNHIIFQNINTISNKVLAFLESENYTEISIKIDSNITLNFKTSLLYTIFERIDNYTFSINPNLENNLKFNIIYKKVLNDIINDNKNMHNNFYNDLLFYGYQFIMYKTLENLNLPANIVLGKNLNSNTSVYYLQVNFQKYWFNLDIISNFNTQNSTSILQSDKEFYKTHSTECVEVKKCTISYKKFYKKYSFFNAIKNKFLLLVGRNKKELLGLPAPNIRNSNPNTIFQNIDTDLKRDTY